MIQKTKNYDMFVFRNDNREKVKPSHVQMLKRSISTRNLLEMRPICVNKDMEVIDGQHRLLAAEELGLDIYYQVEDKLEVGDVILMNTSKNWTNADFLNFYVKNGYQEYIKLNDFMKLNQISFKVAYLLINKKNADNLDYFKHGEFKMKEIDQTALDICRLSVDHIKNMNGYAHYLHSGRFWKSLICMIQHPEFELKRWMSNLSKLTNRMGIRATSREYLQMIWDVYNHGLVKKIRWEDEDV
jgi:hypothetical protein